ATFYEVFTGKPPFESRDERELIHSHIARTPVPPHQRAPERSIPEIVSAIVLKLLAKSPEDRYQTAAGVATDLARAAEECASNATFTMFELGTMDWEDRVRPPSRLVGRDEESATLRRAWEQIAGGTVELVWVAGTAGVGKSALVHALRDVV